MSSMEKWKARGINTMMGFEEESIKVPFATWNAALVQNGLFTIRKPQGDLGRDAKDRRLLAWMFGDEPDLHDKRGKAGNDPATLQAQYSELKAAAPNKPVLINFSGGDVRGAWQKGGEAKQKYSSYAQAADWICHDLYPVTGWARPDWIDLSRPIELPPEREPERYTVGWTTDALRAISGGKPQLAIIECSNQNLPWLKADKRRGVTADEFRGQLWHAIIHGAVGIGYFPQQIGGGFHFDAMTSEVEREMMVQNRKIAAHSQVLLSPGQRLEVAAPFEVATRTYKNRAYEFVLNYSSRPAQYAGQNYAPYEVRITVRRSNRTS
jgi:hypothetical protein